jgi:ribose transport system substrate-binding protein
MNTIPRSGPRRAAAGAALAAMLCAAVAACSGGSTGSANAAAASGSSTPGAKAAAAVLRAAEARPASLGLPPVTKPIPAGKTVSFVHCGVAVCDLIAASLRNAAGILGWKVDVVPSNGTPASIKAAWDTVVRLHPDVAIGSGFNHTLFASEAAKLQAMHVPIMNWSTLDTVGDGITFVKGGPQVSSPLVGTDMAAWVVTSTGGKADTLYVDLPTYVILKPVATSFASHYKQWCPTCKLASISVPLTAIGTTAPSLIVSYLRAHPGINRIALSYDGLGVGLPAALSAAGLAGKVQFIGESATETNLAYVQAGTEAATVGEPYYEIFAMFLDAAARNMTGQPLAPDVSWQVPWFVITKANYAEGTGHTPVIPNLNGQLRQLWKK